MPSRVVLLLAIAVSTASCSSMFNDVTVTPQTSSVETTLPGTDTTVDAGPSTVDELSYDEVAQKMSATIDAYWTEQHPDVYGRQYETLAQGVFPLKPGDEAPGCDAPSTVYDDVAGNAFYCPAGDFIAYDDADLFPGLYTKFGPFVIGVVLAHEWGHAIQVRGGVSDSVATVTLENQADCFSGAWTRWIADGNAPGLTINGTDLDGALGGLLFFRDQPGTTSADEQAHGSGFDRVGVFQEGFEQGASHCATYETDPPQPLDLQFRDLTELATGGNAPYGDLVTFVTEGLDSFWAGVFSASGKTFTALSVPPHLRLFDPDTDQVSCGAQTLPPATLKHSAFYCAPDDYVGFDEPGTLRRPYDRIGDYAAAIELASGWSEAALERAGSTLTGTARERQRDCLSGAFTGAVYIGAVNDSDGHPVGLSPGDLDEAISEFIASGRSQPGASFERVSSFRNGFLGGIKACDFAV
jgi:predicted metalloprotease